MLSATYRGMRINSVKLWEKCNNPKLKKNLLQNVKSYQNQKNVSRNWTIYEDRSTGNLSDNRFKILAADYEQEQKELNERIISLTAELEQQ